MPSDPLTFWLKGSMFWATILRAQHQAYLKMLCNMANALPRETAAEVAAGAESLRRDAPKPTPLHRRPRAAKKPEQAAKPVPA
ncbi:MAG: hypothetical protein HLUCCA05_03940 [Roseibaca calidilacus]|uniref:Uncharacterized protein n=1 Tax=Roseibaca calidilacus TaxID=1666912 RepID=A0A0P7X5K8_9RHOB|nr:hypothetical protein [Roseibaca calidilacus]KPP95828.1 MAG: hypothetical protein HLUCCA05_03940 [Roseibaca calidilacus]CUX81641.1 hypothetical protein Ga0058931_1887 [Roseibaca calidilacus]